jgi:probable F420-dependent oxidoreductase
MPGSARVRVATTVPLAGVGLADHKAALAALETAGYTDFWTQEVRGFDALTPLAALALQAPRARFGAAIAGVYSRGPALLAMQAAAVAAAAPGRFALGLGTSSEAIVEGWNAAQLARPVARVRDTLRFLRAALAGERIDRAYETFAVRGFRLEHPPAAPPPLLVAALRERMLALAGAEADGVCLGLLSAEDACRVLPVFEAAGGSGKEVFLRVAVFALADAGRARRLARKLLAPYLAAGPYARFHAALGRAREVAAIGAALRARDRDAAFAAIPDAWLDGLVVHGRPEACRAQLARFLAAGVTTLCIDVVASDDDPLATQRTLLAGTFFKTSRS